MSANLTMQLRDLGRTAKAAVEGGLPRSLTVPASGEMAEIFDSVRTISEMRA